MGMVHGWGNGLELELELELELKLALNGSGAVAFALAAVDQRVGDGTEVDILELAARRNAAREPCHVQSARVQRLADDMGRCLAFGGEVGRQDHLGHDAVGGPVEQFLQADVLGSDAVERAELSHQDKVQALVGGSSLNGGLVRWRLDHAQARPVAPLVQAGGADFGLCECVAARAMVDRFAGVGQ